MDVAVAGPSAVNLGDKDEEAENQENNQLIERQAGVVNLMNKEWISLIWVRCCKCQAFWYEIH